MPNSSAAKHNLLLQVRFRNRWRHPPSSDQAPTMPRGCSRADNRGRFSGSAAGEMKSGWPGRTERHPLQIVPRTISPQVNDERVARPQELGTHCCHRAVSSARVGLFCFHFKLQKAFAAEVEGLGTRWSLNNWQFDPTAVARCCRSRQAASKHLLGHLAEFSPLAQGPELHFPNQILRQIDGGFHNSSFPAFQFAVK
jgi:hypothetical protein